MQMLAQSFTLAVFLAATVAAKKKIGVISDLHLNTAYAATASVDDNCIAVGTSGPDDISAPIGRIGCDPSITMVDFMMQRFNEAFGSVDVLLVTGDHIAHHQSPHLGKEQPGDWAKIQANLEAASDLLRKNFPELLVLMNIGNNDGYHDQGPREEQKDEFYSYLYDLWFTQHPGNAEIKDSVKDTFMYAGYYRADISETVSVLTLDNQYMDDVNDESVVKNEAEDQLDWLEAQLVSGPASGRKFILSGHTYAGTRYHGA